MTTNKKGNVLDLGLPKIQTYQEECTEAIAELLTDMKPDKIWLMTEKEGQINFIHSHPNDIVQTVGVMITQAILAVFEDKISLQDNEDIDID